jgi:phosphatidylserine decarboxylase
LNVFTANHREVQYVQERYTGKQFAFVAVGALLVGSISWAHSSSAGIAIDKGGELGWFQYGGSTTILVAPQGSVRWDEDLLRNSLNGVETLLRVGNHIGRFS